MVGKLKIFFLLDRNSLSIVESTIKFEVSLDYVYDDQCEKIFKKIQTYFFNTYLRFKEFKIT